MIFALIIVGSILLDQMVKWLVVTNLAYGERIEVMANFFYITHWKNDGAAWGFFSGQRVLLIGATILAFGFLIVLFKKTPIPLFRYAIVIIIGGAMGNFIDRLFRGGGVVDFLLFYFGKYSFPAFNIADTLIVVATILLFFCVLFEEKLKKKMES
jgi:signal peptidase II